MHQHDAGCAHASGTEAPQPVAVEQQIPTHPPAYVAAPESRAYRFLTALWTRPPWLAPLAVLASIAAAFTYVFAFDPTDQQRDPLGPCAFKAVTGLDCPGCGGTRMVWYLLHGDLGEAARHHVVALIAVPFLAYLFLAWAARRIFMVGLPVLRIPGKAWGGYLAGWLVFSVLRNLPWEPFNYLFVT
jgi:hypothetical protein